MSAKKNPNTTKARKKTSAAIKSISKMLEPHEPKSFWQDFKEDGFRDALWNKFIVNPRNPPAATMEEWSNIHDKQKANHPVAYRIIEAIDDTYYFLRGVFYHPVNNAYWWVRYRTTDKYHVVKTGLKPGYNDGDKRMLYSNFAIFKNHIENRYAYWFDGEEDIITNLLKNIKSCKKDLNEKNWAPWEQKAKAKDKKETLKRAQDRLDEAQEFYRLYKWWTIDRVNDYAKHKEADDAYFKKFYSKKKSNKKSFYDIFRTPKKSDPDYKEQKQRQKESRILHKKEDDLWKKDYENLRSLMKYAEKMW